MRVFGCLIAFGVDPVSWAKRFGIEPVTHPCGDCGAPKTSTIPIASRTLRGLASPPCACGNEEPTPYCLVAAPGEGDLIGVLTAR